jgi:hypothetical protein
MDKYPIHPAQEAELKDWFTYHPPTGDKVGRHEFLRDECHVLARHIKANTQVGREQAVALTKLREVMMWANAAVALEKPSVNGGQPVTAPPAA